MDCLTFISGLIHSLAWPIATVVIAILFRKILIFKLHEITAIKHKETEIKFSHELEQFSREARPLQEAIVESSSSSSSSGNQYSSSSGGGYELIDSQYGEVRRALIEIADVAPWAAVIDGWKRVEAKLHHLLTQAGVEPARNAGEMINQAIAANQIGPTIAKLLSDFYQLRNRAAHFDSQSISREQALEFVDWAVKLISVLDISDVNRCL